MIKDFEEITPEDKASVINKIENLRNLRLKDIKEELKKLSIKRLAITNNEKEVYTYLKLLIEYNLDEDYDYSEISETTLSVLLKDINIKTIGDINSFYHTKKLKSFEIFLNKNIENPKLNIENNYLNLSNSIIHIDNVIQLQKIYKFKIIDAIVIVDDVKKIFKQSIYSEDDFIFSSSSSLYCFCKNKEECDYLDFSMSKTESNSKFRFFLNTINQDRKSFKANQEKANQVYGHILNNSNISSKNTIFKLKLNIYNPTLCTNIENRSIFFNYLED